MEASGNAAAVEVVLAAEDQLVRRGASASLKLKRLS
jgi:hypothetical protein